MSDRLDPKDFGLKLYNRFPPSYRADDVGQKYALKRYIEAAADKVEVGHVCGVDNSCVIAKVFSFRSVE